MSKVASVVFQRSSGRHYDFRREGEREPPLQRTRHFKGETP